ncbi:MAG: TolC family protein [Vicinamibacterales bacterium]
MHARSSMLAAGFLLSLFGAPAAGQVTSPVPASPQVPVLTLAEVVTQTLERNPSLRAARAGRDQAAAGSTIARAAWLPRVSFAESWQRSDQPVFGFSTLLAARRFQSTDFAVDRLNHPGAINAFTSRLGIGQTLFDGGRTPAAIAAADADRAAADAAYDQAAAGVALEVAQTYARAVSLQAAVRAAAAAVDAAAGDHARAERRRDAGTATEADVLAVSVHLADMRQRRLQAEGDLAVAIAMLNRQRGAPVGDVVTVEAPAPPAAASLDVAALTARALAGRPELRAADAAVRRAEAEARQARAVWWPNVSAQAGYEWNGLTFGDRSASWMVGAEARWGLSLSSADAARVRAAGHAADAARARRDDVRAGLEVEVLSAVRQLEAARARVDVGAEALAQATESLRIIRNRYDAGLASVTDVLRASSAELDADARRVAAIVDAIVARASLERAVGAAPGEGIR